MGETLGELWVDLSLDTEWVYSIPGRTGKKTHGSEYCFFFFAMLCKILEFYINISWYELLHRKWFMEGEIQTVFELTGNTRRRSLGCNPSDDWEQMTAVLGPCAPSRCHSPVRAKERWQDWAVTQGQLCTQSPAEGSAKNSLEKTRNEVQRRLQNKGKSRTGEGDQHLSASSRSNGPSSPCSVFKPILGKEGTTHTQRQKLSRMLHQNLEFQVQRKESGRSKQRIANIWGVIRGERKRSVPSIVSSWGGLGGKNAFF